MGNVVLGKIFLWWVMTVVKTLDLAFVGFDSGECAHILCCYFFHSCRIGNYGNREREGMKHTRWGLWESEKGGFFCDSGLPAQNQNCISVVSSLS